jgi:cell division protein FtsB
MSASTQTSSRFVRIAAFAAGLLSIILVAAALLGEHGVLRHEKLREELEHVRELNTGLEADNKRLRAEAEALRSDPDYVEAVIRDELGWVRKNELIFIFPKEKAK